MNPDRRGQEVYGSLPSFRRLAKTNRRSLELAVLLPHFEPFKQRGSFGGRVEIVVRCVGTFYFGVMMRLVASLGGRLTAVSVNALNGRHFREQANAGVSRGINQQPRNGVGILRVHVRGSLTRNLAAVFQFPGGTSEMASDNVVLLIFQRLEER